jgi:toxin YoeB
MIYELILQPEAQRHLEEWKRSGQKKILKKIVDLFSELRIHPTTGTGQVEQLKGNLSGFWSRRIDKSSRMIYTIENEKVIVTVVSLKGHYGDK